MNIGFEAKRAFTNGTGLGHYSRTLISSLAEFFPSHQYYLFTPRRSDRFTPGAGENLHTVLPGSLRGRLFRSAWRSSWVKADIKKKHIQLYHGLSHEIPMGMSGIGIPSVVTMHDLIFERYPHQYNPVDVKIYRAKFQYACRNADRIIAISNQTKTDIVAFYGIDENKIDVCYQSCNDAFARPVEANERERIKEQYGLPDQFFLYVGSIIERKNLLNICKALVILTGKCDLPLVVIGDGGAYKKLIQAYIRTHRLEDRVFFVSENTAARSSPSFRDGKDFPAIYQQATALVYPSFFEGFGIPVLEGFLSRIPVITSNVSCLPETGGEGAYYVDPNSPEEIATALWRVAFEEELRPVLIEKGSLHAQKFTRYNAARSVMDVYRKLSG